MLKRSYLPLAIECIFQAIFDSNLTADALHSNSNLSFAYANFPFDLRRGNIFDGTRVCSHDVHITNNWTCHSSLSSIMPLKTHLPGKHGLFADPNDDFNCENPVKGVSISCNLIVFVAREMQISRKCRASRCISDDRSWLLYQLKGLTKIISFVNEKWWNNNFLSKSSSNWIIVWGLSLTTHSHTI